MNSLDPAMLFGLIVFLSLMLYLFKKPCLIFIKWIIRGAVFSFIIFLLNFITLSFNFHIGLNPVTYGLCGALGGYGFILNYIFGMLFCI